MKIQCACGAKYSLEVTPEMARGPIRFVCQSCGQDSTDFVNELIRRELASTAPVAAPGGLRLASTDPAHPAAGTKRVRVQPANLTQQATTDSQELPPCPKHPGQTATHRCLVCRRPICPLCMEIFGYVCSPYCGAKAEAQGIEVPVYEGRRTMVEARYGRKVGLITGSVAGAILLLLGIWFWFAWIGSTPRTVFSARFASPAESAESVMSEKKQIVLLHSGVLSRYDLRAKREVWSQTIVDTEQITRQLADQLRTLRAGRGRSLGGRSEDEDFIKTLSSKETIASMLEEATSGLRLHASGRNIWIAAPGRLVRYDWDTGKPVKELLLPFDSSEAIARDDELLFAEPGAAGQEAVTRINLATGESRVEKVGDSRPSIAALTPLGQSVSQRRTSSSGGRPMAGLPTGIPGSDVGKPLDPARVAEQAQQLPMAAKIALPAIVANDLNQERIIAELQDAPRAKPPDGPESDVEPRDRFEFIPSPYGYIQYSVRLLEERFVTRKAMKDAPAKSALDGDLTVTKTFEVANEILNELQRSRGGDLVTEDESRYLVTVRCPGVNEAPEWTGEVIGPPTVHPLKTVNAITAGRIVIVLDKSSKKLWQSNLSYRVTPGLEEWRGNRAAFGEGPCVERDGMLFIADEAVLTAFDARTGNVRWRLPSVGIAGMFFDDRGMMYVNTTTASPENIKYSRQIDVTRNDRSVVHKLNPRSGKILWSAQPGGLVSYVSGKYIYLLQAYDADDEPDNPYSTGLGPRSHVWIRRLDPENGRILWSHYQKRAPLSVQFSDNWIQIVFKDELQVLTYFTF